EAFNAINERFQRMFTALFEGGSGSLVLTDPENLLDTGVDIIVQPPGKKLQHISLMSGGEKAMTAIALLFACFQVKPSPFCLMDEVDAALDDTNVRRFASALKAMTTESQFAVITHNKGTMEMADALYGVTMEEPGVSRLISVALTEPEEAVGA
ncbi:MAG: chromosome segregation protein SMC, partial [Nitrospirota bacterium]|nr:chromosome segregation protein SMC [Nitrospirota bacterium]